MNTNKIILFLVGLSLFGCGGNPSFREVVVTMPTYPYSDPNPVINPDNPFYPYWGFDGYTDVSEQKEWKVVELENEFIKLSIFPEIGGKIWGAVEKSTGKEFIYYNHVVKFRHVAMRGPWTSGGIEPNFGIIGHAPTTSSPIDYVVRKNDDGSVSCFIGATELITNTHWCVEVNLQKDRAYFTTKSYWDNSNPLTNPYYHWMNAGYKASDDLKFCFPGTNYIGHAGELESWPKNDQGRELDEYAKNNFGEYKSYHVLGNLSDFYSGYWKNSDFGSVHHSAYNDKLGMKIWIWGLSRQGMIWEDLLTDTDGQYVELQSGRMFNQPATGSTYSPFKQFGFEPYASETWTEYWYPVKSTKGVVKANEYGALNIARENGYLKLYFCPVLPISEKIVVEANGQKIYENVVQGQAMKTWSDSVKLDSPFGTVKVDIGSGLVTYSEVPEENNLSRPLVTLPDFDWNSVYGLSLHGRQWMNQKDYPKAESFLSQCLEKDSLYVPALNDMAELCYRKGHFDEAIVFARKSMAINTYDPAANFIYGLSHSALGHRTDAKDGFSVASYSPSYRSAAYTMLAKEYTKEKNWKKARELAVRALDANGKNSSASQIIVLSDRKMGNKSEASQYASEFLEKLPLNHIMRFEKLLISGQKSLNKEFLSLVRHELPNETLLEIADWYEGMDCYEEALKVLEMSDSNPLLFYRRAYMLYKTGKRDLAIKLLKDAAAVSPAYVSPHGLQTLAALQWARSEQKGWPVSYYLGLSEWSVGNKNKASGAQGLFDECGHDVPFAPFYLCRAQLKEGVEKWTDLKRAESIEKSWRVGAKLIDFMTESGRKDEAYSFASEYSRLFPKNYYIGLKYAQALVAQGSYSECIEYMKKLKVLPNEGAMLGRDIYRDACLLQAMNLIREKNYDKALTWIDNSRLWMENLGIGKPYDEDIDERAENFLAACCNKMKGNKSLADEWHKKVVSGKQTVSPNILFTAWAMKEMGNLSEANKIMEKYKNENKSPVSDYVYYLFLGNKVKAFESLTKMKDEKEAAAWEGRKYNQSDLNVIQEIVKIY